MDGLYLLWERSTVDVFGSGQAVGPLADLDHTILQPVRPVNRLGVLIVDTDSYGCVFDRYLGLKQPDQLYSLVVLNEAVIARDLSVLQQLNEALFFLQYYYYSLIGLLHLVGLTDGGRW